MIAHRRFHPKKGLLPQMAVQVRCPPRLLSLSCPNRGSPTESPTAKDTGSTTQTRIVCCNCEYLMKCTAVQQSYQGTDPSCLGGQQGVDSPEPAQLVGQGVLQEEKRDHRTLLRRCQRIAWSEVRPLPGSIEGAGTVPVDGCSPRTSRRWPTTWQNGSSERDGQPGSCLSCLTFLLCFFSPIFAVA